MSVGDISRLWSVLDRLDRADDEARRWDRLSGLVPEGDYRALHPHELDAGVNFAEMAGSVADVAGRLSRRLGTNRATAIELILGDLRAQPSRAAAVERLAAIDGLDGLGSVPGLADHVALSTQGYVSELDSAARAGLSEVAGEAARQGHDLRRRPLSTVATNVIGAAAQRLATGPHVDLVRALREAATTGGLAGPAATLADELGSTAATLSTAPLDDYARTAAHSAHGTGRAEAAAGDEPAAVYASELLDSNTCGPCSFIDGREYGSLAEGRADYPAGFYRNCDGGTRCRGTLVFVWPEGLLGPGEPPPEPDVPPTPPEPPTSWTDELAAVRARVPEVWVPPETLPKKLYAHEVTAEQAKMGVRPEALHLEHEAIVRDAGRIIDGEAERRIALEPLPTPDDFARIQARIDEAINEARAASDAYYRASNRAHGAGGNPNLDPEVVAARTRLDETRARKTVLQQERAEMEGAGQIAARRVYREVLEEAGVAMGPGPLAKGAKAFSYSKGGSGATGKLVEQAADFMPRRWVEFSRDAGRLDVAKVRRGFYEETSRGDGKLRISGARRTKVAADPSGVEVAAHELGHRMEHIKPEIRRLEWAFYHRRTRELLPDGSLGLQEASKRIYGKEYGRDDLFSDRYMGKTYGNAPESFYELVSMAQESIWTGSYALDPDFRHFYLGLVALV